MRPLAFWLLVGLLLWPAVPALGAAQVVARDPVLLDTWWVSGVTVSERDTLRVTRADGSTADVMVVGVTPTHAVVTLRGHDRRALALHDRVDFLRHAPPQAARVVGPYVAMHVIWAPPSSSAGLPPHFNAQSGWSATWDVTLPAMNLPGLQVPVFAANTSVRVDSSFVPTFSLPTFSVPTLSFPSLSLPGAPNFSSGWSLP